MNISIDGQTVEASGVRGTNLEEIISDLQLNHIESDRIVNDVRLNGELYSEDMPHAATEVPRDLISTLELSTLTSDKIAIHFLRNGQTFTRSIMESLPRITEMFRLGDEAEANEHYLRFLESFHLLINMLIESKSILNLNAVDSPLGEEKSLDEILRKMGTILTDILNIQESNDWIYLADLLEYDLTPSLADLSRIFPVLAEKAH